MENEKLYGYKIVVYKGMYSGEQLEVLKWEGYLFHQIMKWIWYFEYRAALMRIKYPKYRICAGSFDYEITPEKGLISLNNKIKSKKGKITEISNKLRLSEKYWNSLFPIQEDPTYIQFCDKLTKLKEELDDLLNKKQNFIYEKNNVLRSRG